nr:MAG TPA: hypothetical protein [Caudoviricetes sp.]
MARGRLAERRKALQRYFRLNRQHEIIYQTANVLSLSTFKKNSAEAHKKERKFCKWNLKQTSKPARV